MSRRRVGCVDINGIDCRFCLYIRLNLLGLLLLILSAVILIMVDSHSVVRHFVGWCKFSRKSMFIAAAAFELCRERISLSNTFIATSEHTLNSAYNLHESRAQRSP